MKAIQYISEKTLEMYGGSEFEQSRYNPRLFGQHLIFRYPNKNVGIVKEPIFALILAEEQPCFIWVAMGSYFEAEALRILINRKNIYIYPESSKEYDLYNALVYDNNLLSAGGEPLWIIAEPCSEWLKEQKQNLILRNRYPDIFPESKEPLPVDWNPYLEYHKQQYQSFERGVMQPLLSKCGGNRFAAYGSLLGRCRLWDEHLAETHYWDSKEQAYLPITSK